MTTIYDVAKAAGVSSMTVSRALTKPDKVKQETRERIEAIALQMGYRKNHAARALQSNSTGIIKIQMSAGLRGNHLYFSQLFAGITDVLSQHQLAMLLADSRSSKVACDGVILMGLSSEEQQKLVRSTTPKVLFGMGPDSVDWLDLDNEHGTYEATRYLLNLGHRRIGLMDFPSAEPFICKRRDGYFRAMREHGIVPEPGWLLTAVNNSVDAGYACARQFVRARPVSAMVCCSDHVAVGLAQSAHDEHIVVPRELSIFGFDGVGQERMSKPVISTVRQPVFEIGRKLAERLIFLIQNPTDASRVSQWIKPELVLNDSTAPPQAFLAVG